MYYTFVSCRKSFVGDNGKLTGETEAKTRKELIYPALKRAGWDVINPEQVGIEIPADGFNEVTWHQFQTRLKEKEPGV